MKWQRRIVFGILAAVAGVALFGGLVMVLWNAVMPEVFGLPLLGYGQALALLVLSHILLRGWGGSWRRGWGGPGRRWHGAPPWAGWSPEEREKFRRHWEERCAPWAGWEEGRGTAARKPAGEGPEPGTGA